MTIDLRQLRERIPIRKLLHWMSWNPVHQRDTQLRGPCPYCGITDEEFSTAGAPGDRRCFSVNTRRNIFRCFRCGRSGNALDLWALYRNITVYSAAVEIQARLGAPSGSHIKQPTTASQPASKQATAKPATPPKWLNS